MEPRLDLRLDLRRGAIGSGLAALALAGGLACTSGDTGGPKAPEGGAPDASPPDTSLPDASAAIADVGDAARAGDTGSPDTAPADTAAPLRPCGPPPSLDEPVRRLSETGCIDPVRPLAPGPGALYYEVASPLWSDGAGKERWAFFPAGEKVRLKDCRRQPAACLDPELGTGGTYWDEGHVELPEGTVLMKHFSIGRTRVETRLITRTAQGWGTYSYAWQSDQTDAIAVGLDEGAVTRDFPNPTLNPSNDPAISRAPPGTQIWTYPARTDCIRCHTDEAGFQLGLQLAQLDHTVTYPDGTRENQIDHWQSRGLFETPPPRPAPTTLPPPGGAAGTLEQRARSYLHANCAGCHRPGSKFPFMDLRWTTPFAATGTCNVPPTKGELGVAGARRIVPGQPRASVLSLRVHTLEERFRMPQVGRAVLDAQGARLIDDWIASLPGGICPEP